MTDLPMVVVTRAVPDDWLEPLRGRCELRLGPADRGGIGPEIEPLLATTDGILCMLTEHIDASVLDRMPRLRVVSNMAVGVDNIDVDACTRRKVPVGNTPGVLTDATADLTMTLLLATSRRILEAHRDASNGQWTLWSPTGWLGADLRDAVLGIVGFGNIGQAVALRARAFGMCIRYASRTPRPQLADAIGATHVSFDEPLQTADFVSLHVPLTAQTRHMIGATELARMKPTSILINTARGPIVDQHALVAALTARKIAGAGIDVTDPEPLSKTDLAWRVPNLLITPHIGSATHGTRRAMARLACENVLAGIGGLRLPHCVNPQVYDGRDPPLVGER